MKRKYCHINSGTLIKNRIIDEIWEDKQFYQDSFEFQNKNKLEEQAN